MQRTNFPMCCTAKIIYDFGGTQVSDHIHTMSEGQIEKWIEEQLRWAGTGYVFVAITNSDQKAANSVLKKMGFSHSKWMTKAQHPETKVRLWWIQAHGGSRERLQRITGG